MTIPLKSTNLVSYCVMGDNCASGQGIEVVAHQSIACAPFSAGLADEGHHLHRLRVLLIEIQGIQSAAPRSITLFYRLAALKNRICRLPFQRQA
jgi:hypothetical protein